MLQKEIKEMAATIAGAEKQEKVEKKFLINRELLPYKLHFFLFVGGMGAVLPYIPVFAVKSLGFSATSLAAIYTTQQFVFILGKPAIGYLTDYFNKLKTVIIALTVIQGVGLFLLLPIPRVEYEPELDMNDLRAYPFRQNVCKFCDTRIISSKDTQVHENISNTFSDNLNYDVWNVFFFSKNDTKLKYPNDYIVVSALYYAQEKFTEENKTSTKNENMLFSTTFFLEQNIKTNFSNCLDVTNYPPVSDDSNISSVFNCYNVQNFNISDILEEWISQDSAVFCDESDKVLPSRKNNSLDIPNTIMFQSYQFWLFAVTEISAGICITALFTLSDTACYESIQTTGGDFGKQRLWGAFSWGIVAPFAGFLIDYTNSFLISWCLMAIFCTLQIWNVSRLNLIKPHFKQSILKDIGIIMKSKEFLAFTFGVIMNGIATGIVWFYLAWFYNDIGGNSLLVGLAHLIQCFLGELPFMFFSGWIIKRIGHFNVISLAIFAHCVRFFWYSYFRNPWIMLVVESLHGFTFGVFYSAMTSYGKMNAKLGTEATTQSILGICYEGFGAGSGCVLFGICFDIYGGHKTFFFAGVFCAIATAINVAFTLFFKRKVKKVNVTPYTVT